MIEVVEIENPVFDVETGESKTDVVEIGQPGPVGPVGPQGPQGIQGVPGPEGPAGPTGGLLERQMTVAAPATVWEMAHDIPITPAVYTFDASDQPIFGDVSFPSATSVRVAWAYPMAGRLVVTT